MLVLFYIILVWRGTFPQMYCCQYKILKKLLERMHFGQVLHSILFWQHIHEYVLTSCSIKWFLKNRFLKKNTQLCPKVTDLNHFSVCTLWGYESSSRHRLWGVWGRQRHPSCKRKTSRKTRTWGWPSEWNITLKQNTCLSSEAEMTSPNLVVQTQRFLDSRRYKCQETRRMRR